MIEPKVKHGAPSLMDVHYEQIQQHIIDPQNSPLPERLRPQFARVMDAARLLDDYPDETHVIALMQEKHRVSVYTIRRDIELARQLYKTRHTFDWDFWQAWQIKDQLELIALAKRKGDLKAWNNAKKVLASLIGEKPEAVEDPRRMEKNVFTIQVQYNGQQVDMDFSKLQNLPSDVRQMILKEMLYKQADDAQVEEIMNS